MIHLSTEKGISKEALREFYAAKKIKKYENRDQDLYHAVINSDYIVTAWDGHKLIGIIRSSGDHIFSQYITNFLIHDDYSARGIGSKMIDTYLESVEDVMDVYIISGQKITKSFTIDWFKYKGFEQVEMKDELQVFKRKNKPEE